MTVWIAQCLCRCRHAILAQALLADNESDAIRDGVEPLREAVNELLASGEMNPWCAICKASAETWHYEVGRTRFATMAEAEPELLRVEAENLAFNALFGDLDRKQKPN